ncbi:MAG: ROK family protein [Opitutaceae bacterium]
MKRNFLHAADLEAEILKRVRASDGVSRVDLARSLELAPSTVGIYVERLIEDGYLEETYKAVRETGRPPMLLSLNPERGEFIGVDFEARSIMAVAVDFSDKPLRNAHAQIKSTDSVDEIIGKIEDTVSKVLPRDSNRLLAIGVGVPGLVNSSAGIAVHYRYIAHWQNIPLAEYLRKKFNVPVFLENTARSMALAEMWFGQGQGVSNFLCLGIRSGIGVGMIFDGRLHCGAGHGAGEIGSWRCPVLSGKAAKWFATDEKSSRLGLELEEISSARALQRALERAVAAGAKTILSRTASGMSFRDIVAAVQQRDPLTLSIVGEAARCLGWAIGQMSLLVDPKKVIIAGPLTMLGEHLLNPVRETTNAVVPLEDMRRPEIVNSNMGDFSGALGAAALALHEWKPLRTEAAAVG